MAFQYTGEGYWYKCDGCGYRVQIKPTDVHPPEKWYCSCGGTRELGDLVESLLKRVGITPAKWIDFKVRYLGAERPKCGCWRRKQTLNQFSRRWRYRYRRCLSAIRHEWSLLKYALTGRF